MPKRHDFTHNQPRSSIGSPRWASSQSSTARMPSGADDEVAVAEVAVHEASARGGRRRDARRRASAARARTSGAVRRSGRAAPRYCSICCGRVLDRQRRAASATVDRVDARRDRRRTAPPAAAARPRTRRRGGCARGIVSPSMRSITNPAPSVVVGFEQDAHPRDRHTPASGGLQERVLGRALARSDVRRRIAPQHEAVHLARGRGGIERPGLARRAARHPPQCGHGDRCADRARRDRFEESGFDGRTAHGRETLSVGRRCRAEAHTSVDTSAVCRQQRRVAT